MFLQIKIPLLQKIYLNQAIATWTWLLLQNHVANYFCSVNSVPRQMIKTLWSSASDDHYMFYGTTASKF